MNKVKKIIVLASFYVLSNQVFGADLLMVYKQALENDPTFQMARAQWLSDKENIAITRGALLPAFDIGASYGRYMQDVKSQSSNQYYNQGAYSLTLTQPIFNFKSWSQLAQAKATVKSSAATYSNSAQDLIYRTASAYLNILQANDVLRFTTAQKMADASLLEQTKQRFNVGLSTITDVHNAQASYDNDVALEITAKNDLDVAKEQLREITGQYNESFALLSTKLPLVTPAPNNIENWVAAAEKQNYSLISVQYDLQAARENIKVQAGNGMPVIDATGSYSYSDGGSNYNSQWSGVSGDDQKIGEGMVGVNLTFPVFRGGATIAQVHQAQYDYQKASASLEQTRRSVVSQTSQAYLGVISGIGSVKANKQAVISNQSSLDSTKASYSVGVNTIVDVLLAESALYEAQKNYAIAQYTYLTQTLALKQQVGTLGFDDLRKINSWLRPEKPEQPMVIKAGYTTKAATIQKTSITASTKKTEAQPAAAKKQVASSSRSITAAEQKIFSINPNHYTIQLLAAHEANKLMDLVNKNNIKEPIYTFQTNSNGQIWYDLIVGDYQSLSEAKSTANKLSLKIEGLHPWIRTFASVQEAIKK